jgi:hypothetical protein
MVGINVLPLAFSVPPGSLLRPPFPPGLAEVAELLVKVQLFTVAVAPGALSRPPPRLPAVLLVKVLPLTVAVPALSRPPPKVAELLVKVQLLTVAVAVR